MPLETVAAFIDALRQGQLFTPAKVDKLARQIEGRFPTARALAQALAQRGLLTGYQVNQLLQGHGQELVLGSYLLLERVGEGGMGQVFKAKHRKLDRIVALKVIRKDKLTNAEAVQRFRREIQAAAQLMHPNIVLAFDADQVGETNFYVMEYVEGADLGKHVKATGPLSAANAGDYIRQAALGLQHAHEKGMVHRDIKPTNLLLSAKAGPQGAGVVKLLDLGLARLEQGDGDGNPNLTQLGKVVGTVDYIAPEQALNASRVDVRADLYSMGCTLYYLLMGKPPFSGGTPLEKCARHRFEEPKPVEKRRSDVPADLLAVMRKLMAKKPEDRFQTPAELAAALSAYAGKGAAAPNGIPTAAPMVRSSPHIELPTGAAVPVAASVAAPSNDADVPIAVAAGLPPLADVPMADFAVDDKTPLVAARARRRPPTNGNGLLVAGISVAVVLGGVLLLAFLTAGSSPPAKESGKPPDLPPEARFTNSIGMPLVFIRSGTFQMGTPEGDSLKEDDELPRHEVLISKPFYLGAHPVTQDQFEKVMGRNASSFTKEQGAGPSHPVDSVSWQEAVEFCDKLSARPTEKQAGRVYRLPTEAEWEYACRAGTKTAYAFGELASLDQYAWHLGNSGQQTHPVGQLRPNAWGLYDMHGNVWEWCSDSYDATYYKTSPRVDPPGPDKRPARVCRGGAFDSAERDLRAARRSPGDPTQRWNNTGFRVACGLPSR